MESTQEIQCREDEAGEGHALGVGGGVGSGEMVVEATEPVFDMEGFIEGGIFGVIHT